MIFLQETDRRHMDIVNTYRTHLISAVQVCKHNIMLL
jgi:hypothetical protein